MNKRTKKLLIVFLHFAIFFLISYPIILAVYWLIPDFDTKNMVNVGIMDFVISLTQTIIICIIDKNMLKKEYKNLKSMFSKNTMLNYLKTVFIGFLYFLLVKTLASLVVTNISELMHLEEQTVENQSLIEQILGSAPAMMIISACILAPIVEEIVFRGAIRQVIKNKWVFITVSGLIFGLIHVTDSLLLISEILLVGIAVSFILTRKNITNKRELSVLVSAIIVIIFSCLFYFQYGNLIAKIFSLDLVEVIGSITYITMGVFLAFVYVKENNIYINIGIHSLNNILSMIVLLSLT